MAISLPFFVISDTHFGHKNIVRYCSRPLEHEQIMIKRWKRVVKTNDVVLHLGDLFFGGQEGYEHFRDNIAPELPGKKYLILGNHDKRKFDYEACGFVVVKPFEITYRNYAVSFDHYPKILDPEDNLRRIHLHGHIHSHPYARGVTQRWANVNVSVEVMDYRPHRVARLLNREIRARNGGKDRYSNSRHVRWQRRDRQRRVGS